MEDVFDILKEILRERKKKEQMEKKLQKLSDAVKKDAKRLEKNKKMLDDGIITQEEFEKMRRKILG